jgi:hypothetical protein
VKFKGVLKGSTKHGVLSMLAAIDFQQCLKSFAAELLTPFSCHIFDGAI